MSITLKVHENGGVSIVEASGKLTLGDAVSELPEEMSELTGRGSRQILLNMAQVSYVDSSGIGALVASHRVITRAGGVMKLSNLPGRVQRLLLLTELSKTFDTFTDEQSALDSFRAARPPAN
jgi:anti-sigma B factor antagonist